MSYNKKCKCGKLLTHSNKTGLCFFCKRKENFTLGKSLNWSGKSYSKRYDKEGNYIYVVK